MSISIVTAVGRIVRIINFWLPSSSGSRIGGGGRSRIVGIIVATTASDKIGTATHHVVERSIFLVIFAGIGTIQTGMVWIVTKAVGMAII